MRKTALLLGAGVLGGAVLALYWRSLGNPLVFDDLGLSSHRLRTHYLHAASRLGLRWLSDASFGWIHAAAGETLFWQRLANVLLHVATAVALGGFLARLFARVTADPRAPWLALGGALLFALHPVAVYGVGYLVERSIVMATLFSVLSLWLVLEGLERRSLLFGALAVLAYALAVSSKEHAVMVPAVALALAVLLGAGRRLALPLVLMALVAAAVVWLSRGVLLSAYEPLAGDIPLRTYAVSVVNQAFLFFRYVLTWLFPWPGWMAIDLRTSFPASPLDLPYAAAFVGWLAWGVLGLVLVLRRGRAGLAGLAMLWPWLFALTEFAPIRLQEPFVLYRSYLWMAGLPLALPAAVHGLGPRVQAALVGAACIALAAVAHERLQTLSSPFAAWNDAVAKNRDLTAPYVERAYVNRGLLHLDAGRIDAARADLERAVELNPRSADAYLARGSLRLNERRPQEALADFERALAIDPGYASAFDKRCMAKRELSGAAAALPDCRRAVELDPANHDAWVNLGALYHASGRRAEALEAFEHALDLNPASTAANYNYAMLLLEGGRRDDLVRRRFVAACDGGLPQACELLRRSRAAP